MKVLIAGDTHGDLPQALWLCQYAHNKNIDLIIQVGDWGYLWPGDNLRSWKILNKQLNKFAVDMWFLDGNHEWYSKLSEMGADPNNDTITALSDRVTYLPRGYVFTLGNKKFMSFGGAISVDKIYRQPGVSWFEEERITYAQVARAIEKGKVDILLSHDAPYNVAHLEPMLFKDQYKIDPSTIANRKLLLELVKEIQPELIIHGHYHYRYESYVMDLPNTKVIGLDRDGTRLDSIYELEV